MQMFSIVVSDLCIIHVSLSYIEIHEYRIVHSSVLLFCRYSFSRNGPIWKPHENLVENHLLNEQFTQKTLH